MQEIHAKPFVCLFGSVFAAKASEDGVAGVALDENFERAERGAVGEAKGGACALTFWRIGPAGSEAEFEGCDYVAVVGW